MFNKKLKFGYLGIVAGLLIILLSSNAFAQINIDETRIIGENRWYEIPISGNKGDILNVELQVIEGDPVDFILMDDTWSKFVTWDGKRMEDAIGFGSSRSAFGVLSTKYSYEFDLASPNMWVIIDNTDELTESTKAATVHIKVNLVSPTPTSTIDGTTITYEDGTTTISKDITIQYDSPTPSSPGFESIVSVLVILALVIWRKY